MRHAGRILQGEWNVRRGGTVTALVIAAAALGACAETSSDEICDDACGRWDRCVNSPDDLANGTTCMYTYEKCYSDCKQEGDWTEDYIECLKGEQYCCEFRHC